MKRRNFLKAVGAGVAFLALPSLAMPKAVGVINHKRLTDALEEMFICKEGEASAFMEFDAMNAFKYLTPQALHSVWKSGDEVIRLTYQTIAYAVEGGTEDEAQAKLSMYLFKEFKKIAQGSPQKKMLIWRTKPKFSSFEKVIWGDTWKSAEQIEDRVDLGEMPDGVEYDWETNSYKYINYKTMVHKIRMRLIIPEVMFDEDEYHPLAKPEGVTMTPRLEV